MKKTSTLLLSGAAAFVMANGQTVYAACSPGATAGNDTISCSGTSVGINTQAGDDILTNSGVLGVPVLGLTTRMGTGNDTFNNNTGGAAVDVRQEGDNDTANVNGGIVTSLTQGSGNDTLNSNGGLTTSADQGGDNDTATINAGSVTVLNQGGGNDIFNSNGGSTGTVNQGDGNDDANITAGTIAIVLDQGNDDDDVIMSGGFLTSLIQGSGQDTFDLSAGTAALVTQGSGNDEASWSGGNLLLYFGGDGSDSLTVSGATGYDGTSLLDGGDDLSSADGFSDVLTLQGFSSAVIDSSLITNWETVGLSGSLLTFSNNALTVGSDPGDGLFLYGLSFLRAPNGFALTGNLSLSPGSNLGYTGVVPGTNAFSVSGNVVNNGGLLLRNSAVGDVFTVDGNYEGSGDLGIDVDGTSGTSDLLVVNGDVTGGTTIVQSAFLGQGSFTGDGPGAGIPVVRVAGNTAPGDFMLYETFLGIPLGVGAFAYELSLESDNTWYLQSTIRGSAAAAIPAGGMAASLGEAFLGTYHERTGERQQSPDSNVWGRIIGQFGGGSVAASGVGDVDSTGATTGLQAGLDLMAHENAAGGKTRLGLYGGLGWMNHDVVTAAAGGAAGTNEASGKVAGLYASHTKGGFYADAVLQGQWLDVDISGGGATIGTDARGWLASLEVGQAIPLTGSAWLEPQAQLIAGSNSTDAALSSTFDNVSWSDDEVLVGRIGGRLKSAKVLGNGSAVSGWLKANIWTDFKNDDQSASITYGAGSNAIAAESKKTWVDLGIGFDVQASSNIAFFVDGDMAFGISGDYQAFNGKAGMKVDF